MGGKLEVNWDGPFLVAECLGKGAYKLEKLDGTELKQRVCSTRLKRYLQGERCDGLETVENSPPKKKLRIDSKPEKPTDFPFNPPSEQWQKKKCKELGFEWRYPCSSGGGNLVTRDVKADGNCFFRCLAHFVTGSEDDHSMVRKVLCRYMCEELDADFCQKLLDEPADSYLEKTQMAQNGVWGTTNEIFAAANWLNTTVTTWSQFGDSFSWQRHNPKSGSVKAETATIFINHLNRNHFQVVTD